MIKGYCTTNLDEYENEKWPEVFACVPQKGDKIRAISGKTLKVCQITHYSTEEPDRENGELRSFPRIKIELNH